MATGFPERPLRTVLAALPRSTRIKVAALVRGHNLTSLCRVASINATGLSRYLMGRAPLADDAKRRIALLLDVPPVLLFKEERTHGE